MDDTLVIRQQIEETKLQLTDKLECLEQQVSQTVQSAGDAVAATVEAVQGTVESVTGAVEGAVHSVGEAFDLQQQIDSHPFLVLGGAVALGYIAAECMTGYERAQRSRPISPVPMDVPRSLPTNPLWNELKAIAIGVLVGSIQGVALRAVPEIVGAMMGNIANNAGHRHETQFPRVSPQSQIPSNERPNLTPTAKTRPSNFI